MPLITQLQICPMEIKMMLNRGVSTSQFEEALVTLTKHWEEPTLGEWL